MKRSENFFTLNSKRPRLEDQCDDIWGDDPEIDEVDRCINMATQMCSKGPENNNSLNYTSYDDFKAKPNIFASTQAFLPPTNVPSTSGFVPKQENKIVGSVESIRRSISSNEEIPKLLQQINFLQSEKNRLTEMNESKNGEITILRSQLKQAQKNMDSEKMEKLRVVQEKQQQWDSKFNVVDKELTGYKCELDFKNLEIANLKDKLSELKKVCNSNYLNMSISSEMNTSQIVRRNKNNGEIKKSTTCKVIQTDLSNYSYPLTSITIYPLRNVVPQSFFEKCREININSKLNNTKKISTLLNDKSAEQTLQPQGNNLICISYFYPDIQKLINCSKDDLNNSEQVFNFIEHILRLTKSSLFKLLNQLNTIKDTLTYDDIENMNKFYLEEKDNKCKHFCIYSANLWHDNETAVELRRYIAILSSLVPHCEKLQKQLFVSYTLFDSQNQMEIDDKTEQEFLILLLEIVTLIKNIRRSDQFCGLLSAILKLLGNLSSCKSMSIQCYEAINQILKQIIFSRPTKPVLMYVAESLKHLSRHMLFIVKLCNLKKYDATPASVKDGLLFYSEDSCALRVLTTELESCKMNSEMSFNVMQFLVNSVTCNVFWMYYQDEHRCECLAGIYSLGIDVLYNILQKNRKLKSKDTTKIKLHYRIFRSGIIFLNILTARIPDLIIRRSRLHPQYKCIIKYLNRVQKEMSLEKNHETALENLMSQFHSQIQKQSQNKNSDYIFNNKVFL